MDPISSPKVEDSPNGSLEAASNRGESQDYSYTPTPERYTLIPEPYTPIPEAYTPVPKPYTPIPDAYTLVPEPYTPIPGRYTFAPER
jgi:hypothetical protein